MGSAGSPLAGRKANRGASNLLDDAFDDLRTELARITSRNVPHAPGEQEAAKPPSLPPVDLRFAARRDLLDRLDHWCTVLPIECPDRAFYLRARAALLRSLEIAPLALAQSPQAQAAATCVQPPC